MTRGLIVVWGGSGFCTDVWENRQDGVRRVGCTVLLYSGVCSLLKETTIGRMDRAASKQARLQRDRPRRVRFTLTRLWSRRKHLHRSPTVPEYHVTFSAHLERSTAGSLRVYRSRSAVVHTRRVPASVVPIISHAYVYDIVVPPRCYNTPPLSAFNTTICYTVDAVLSAAASVRLSHGRMS